MKPAYASCFHPGGCTRPALLGMTISVKRLGSVDDVHAAFCAHHLDDAVEAIREFRETFVEAPKPKPVTGEG